MKLGYACDKCKKEIKKNTDVVFMKIDTFNGRIEKEICHKCLKQLIESLKGDK